MRDPTGLAHVGRWSRLELATGRRVASRSRPRARACARRARRRCASGTRERRDGAGAIASVSVRRSRSGAARPPHRHRTPRATQARPSSADRAQSATAPATPARLALLRAVVDPRRRADVVGTAARPEPRRARLHRVVSRRTSTPTARCRAASTGAARTRCPSTTATASSSTWSPSTYRYTGDRALVERMWPRVMPRPANAIDSLRASAATPEWREAANAPLLRPAAALDQPRGLLGQADALLLGRLCLRCAGCKDATYLARRSQDAEAAPARADPRRVRTRPGRLDARQR